MQTDVKFIPSSPLANFFASQICQPPTSPSVGLSRADLFVSMSEFHEIHASVCNAGQSAPASADGHPEGAYACFIKNDGRIIELDGSRPGAIDRGPCDDLITVALIFLWDFKAEQTLMKMVQDVARLVKEVFMKGIESDKYNLMYLGE